MAAEPLALERFEGVYTNLAVPFEEIGLEEFRRYRREVAEAVLRIYERTLASEGKRPDIFELQPSDVELAAGGNPTEDWVFSVATAGSTIDFINFRTGKKEVKAIYGLIIDEPSIPLVKLEVWDGNIPRSFYRFDRLSRYESHTAVLFPAIMLNPDSSLLIKAYFRAAGDFRIVLLGWVAKPAGEVVSPNIASV